MPQIKPADHRAVIGPFIDLHVGDAAFYWQQRDRSVDSALTFLGDLLRFDRLLQANLDGVIASKIGWDAAWDALVRWTGPGEVFVCTVLALQSGVDQALRLSQVLKQVLNYPDYLLRGFISALLWSDSKDMAPLVSSWTENSAHAILQVAAWRAIARAPQLAVHPDTPKRLIAAMQRDGEPWLRAAACRAGAVFGATDALKACFQDNSPEVAAEAAIALASLGSRTGDAPLDCIAILSESIRQVFQNLPEGGLERERVERRLLRWLRHLALIVPLDIADMARFLGITPPRLGLHFVLHHADPAHLPWVVQQMKDGRCARLAGWVWQAITGIDLELAELSLPKPAQPTEWEAPERETDELDVGLPLPCAQRVAAYPVKLPSAPVLLGQSLDKAGLLGALTHAPQPLRWNAAHRLATLEGNPIFNIRARADMQHALLNMQH